MLLVFPAKSQHEFPGCRLGADQVFVGFEVHDTILIGCKSLCSHQKNYGIYGNVNCEHTKRWERQEILRRLIEEDICFLYIPMEKLAKVAAVEMPVTRAITDMLAVLVEDDYRSKGLTLADLGLQGRTKAEIVKIWKARVEQNFKALDRDLGCFWGLWV